MKAIKNQQVFNLLFIFVDKGMAKRCYGEPADLNHLLALLAQVFPPGFCGGETWAKPGRKSVGKHYAGF